MRAGCGSFLSLLLLALAGCGSQAPAPPAKPASPPAATTLPSLAAVWDFEDAAPGGLPSGVVTPRGSWEIRELADAPAGPRALAQAARNSGDTFNLAVFAAPKLRDLELSVELKALEGREDQGGGLVWRYRDADNYYLARANPLENNYRVYKVVAGRRQMLQSVRLTIASGWHSLRVRMQGSEIECFFDGRSYLKVNDDTFAEAGRVGLWTKADAVTAFDNLRVEPLPAGTR